MSKRILGLWNFGDSTFHSLVPPESAKSLIREAIRSGIYSFDSAFSYKSADNYLSSVIRTMNIRRECIEITSKVMPVPTLKEKARISLKRLSTAYYDSLLLHWPTEEKQLYSSLRDLEELRNNNITREIGVSNFPIKLLGKIKQDFPITIHERPLSLIWDKDYQEEKELGLKTFAYAPLGMGMLCKYSKELDDMRRSLYIFSSGKREYQRLMNLVNAIAERHSTTNAVVALSWVNMQNPYAIVFGISRKEHLYNSPIPLDRNEFDELTELAARLSEKADKDNIFGHEYLLR